MMPRSQIRKQIIIELLESVVFEMAQTVKRAAHHPIFSEINDFSCAIVDNKGRLVVQSIGNSPHLGTMYTSVNAALDYLNKENIDLYEGDVIVVNDPYLGGNHLPDVLVLMPIFHDNDIMFFSAVRGHHGDIGGCRPGSFAGDSLEIFQEGIRIPPVKLYEKGNFNRYIMDLLTANVRTPDYFKGDLLAQVAGVKIAEKRVKELTNKFGIDNIISARDWYFDYGRKVILDEISKWPKVTAEGEDYLDNDGVTNKPIKIKVKVMISNDEVYVDFSGSSPQVDGPVNATYGVTLSATYNAFISLLDPNLPINFGTLEPIKVYAPEGTVVNAKFPSAVVSGNTETGHRVTDAIWTALAKILPDKIPAADMGTTYNVSAGGIDYRTMKYYVWYLSPPGGMGARPNKDGLSAITGGKLGGTAAHISIEIFETRFPWYVVKEELAIDSGGPGKYRGGLGIEWVIKPVKHSPKMTVVIDRIEISPYGLYGGYPGLHGLIAVKTKNGEIRELPSKGTFMLSEGDELIMRTPGGGGYGDPLDRDPELVLYDVINGYVSREAAFRDYGVVITEDFKINYEETKKIRLIAKSIKNRSKILIDQYTKPYSKNSFRLIEMKQ
jgi:N-methylhydantoinase B